MSGAIGPGSIVQRCPPAGAGRFFTVGALYRVAAIGPAGYCSIHGDIDHTLVIAGVPYPEAGAADGWCPHHFRLWPPPPDEALRNEEAPQDESIPASFCARMATRWEAYGDWWAKDAAILRQAIADFNTQDEA